MPTLPMRLNAFLDISRSLSAMSDDEVTELLASGRVLGSGIGGGTSVLDINDVRVFAKKIPLTDIEVLPENRSSTANVFDLPTYYQYPMGSAGYGAWRELAAHAMTTAWVRDGGYPGFPLTYHSRVLPGRVPDNAGLGSFADIDEAVTWWDGSAAIRRRLEAIRTASRSVVVFMEFIPQTLRARLAQPDADVERIEAQLNEGLEFMGARGFVHFDGHFNNILTDDDHVYFSDLGLATCDAFDLSEAERRFLAAHRNFDRAYVRTGLAAGLVERIRGDVQHLDFLRSWRAGDTDGAALSSPAAAIVDRYAPLATATLEFHQALETSPKASARWPAELACD